jgi:hypothetical protein
MPTSRIVVVAVLLERRFLFSANLRSIRATRMETTSLGGSEQVGRFAREGHQLGFLAHNAGKC